MVELNAFDFGAAIAQLEEKRVADFMRFINRQIRNDPSIGVLPFKDGWHVMVGRYAEHLAARS